LEKVVSSRSLLTMKDRGNLLAGKRRDVERESITLEVVTLFSSHQVCLESSIDSTKQIFLLTVQGIGSFDNADYSYEVQVKTNLKSWILMG